MTDSGGLQKEAYFFEKQCITLRDETEWVELVECGSNTLVGADKAKILEVYKNSSNLNLYGGENIIQSFMKIAHIPNDNILGVEKKIKNQSKAALNLGLDIDFIILNSNIDKIENNLKLIKLKSSQNNFISKIQKKLFKFSLISRSVDLNEYDYILVWIFQH